MFHAISFEKMKNKFKKKNGGSLVRVILIHGIEERGTYYITPENWFVFWIWIFRYNRDFYDVVPNYKDECINVYITDASLYEVSKEILNRHTKA